MERQAVASSNLSSVGFDPKSETLEVEFRNGSVFQYDGVPQSVFDSLVSAPSVGQFFASNIRTSFPFTRL